LQDILRFGTLPEITKCNHTTYENTLPIHTVKPKLGRHFFLSHENFDMYTSAIKINK